MTPADLPTPVTELPRPATVAPTARRRRRWPIVLVCLLALLAVPAAFYLYQSWATASELAAAIAEAEQHDPRWRFEQIVEDMPAVADADNPALVCARVDALTRPAGGFDVGQKNYHLFDELPPERQLNMPQAAVVRAALDKHPEAVKLARTLKDFPGEGRFPIKHSGDFLSTNIEPLQRCRGVMSLLEHDAMLRAEEGDFTGAVQSSRAALVAARSIGREPNLIAALIRVAGQTVAVKSLERTLAQGEAPADELRAMQELLAREAEAPVLAQAMRGERAGLDSIIVSLQTGQVKLSALGAGTGNGWGDWLLGMFPGVITHGRAEQLRLMNRAVEAAKLPPEQARTEFAAIEQTTKESRSFVTRMLMPAVAKVAQADRRTRAWLRCATAAVAAERYRIDRGDWPVSLEALVQAGLLPAVPTDPCDGNPLRYRRLADGVVVYSVGMDGIDNGGHLDRSNPTAPGGDLGFRLWDPAARRQPPLPPPPVEPEQP